MITANVLNLESLNTKLTELSRLDLEKVINRACLVVERDAKKNCPVDTGELRNSIISQVHTEGNTVVGEVGPTVSYGKYVEFGTGLFAANGDGRTDVPWVYRKADGTFHSTSGQMPQPFLKPALDDNKAKIKSLIKEEIKSEVNTNV